MTSSYYADTTILEAARVLHEDDLLSRHLRLFPVPVEQNLPADADILDLACRTGGWVLDVAHAYPRAHIIGGDASTSLLEHARLLAQAERALGAEFRQLDVTQYPLPFEKQSVDLIHARLLDSVLPRNQWPLLIQEAHRLLRPGGCLVVSEYETAVSTSPVLHRLNQIFLQGMYAMGKGFSAGTSLGISHRLPMWFSQAGFLEIESEAYAVNCSYGTEMANAWNEELFAIVSALHSRMISAGVTTQEEMQALIALAAHHVADPTFVNFNYFVSVWGRKG